MILNAQAAARSPEEIKPQTVYLYYLGDENTDFTGGWVYRGVSSSGTGSGSCTKNANNIALTVIGNINYGKSAYLSTNNKYSNNGYVLNGYRYKFYHSNTGNTWSRFGNTSNTSADSPAWINAGAASSSTTAFAHADIATNGQYYFGIDSTDGTSYGTSTVTMYAAYMAKSDDISSLSAYGNTISSIISNASSLFSNQTAVQNMVTNCTGEFMWRALADNSFVTAMKASSYYSLVTSNEDWAKSTALLNY